MIEHRPLYGRWTFGLVRLTVNGKSHLVFSPFAARGLYLLKRTA